MKVSVIIPTYNRANLLIEAVNSILNQTVSDLEILIVDDGSTDKTSEIAQKFGEKVRYFRQDHGGLNVARNLALANASGQYITLLDDDDLWLKDKLNLQISLMDRFPELVYAFSDFFILKEDGRQISKGLSTWFTVPPKWEDISGQKYRYSNLGLSPLIGIRDFDFYKTDIYGLLLRGPCVLPSCAIIRKSCIASDIKFVDDNWLCGDWEFFAKLSRKHPCGYLDIETTVNRSHDDTVRITRRNPISGLKDRLALVRSVWKADNEFYEKHRGEVDRIVRQQLISIVKYLLLESDSREAKKYLRELKTYKWENQRFKILLLYFFAYFPGGHKLLAMFR